MFGIFHFLQKLSVKMSRTAGIGLQFMREEGAKQVKPLQFDKLLIWPSLMPPQFNHLHKAVR